jgi:glucokinase
MNVLAGDIGGTKTILAVVSTEAGPRVPVVQKTYSSHQYQTLESMVSEFLGENAIDIGRACFGVAGPVVGGRARITNLAWVVDGAALRSTFGWSSVDLLNDMEAIGNALPVLEPQDLCTMSAGTREPGGSMAILAPGTGLGEGYVTHDDGVYHAHGCEGSHAAFAPVGPLQMGLLAYMNAQGFDHVNFERVCSGGLGVVNLYAYLKSTGLTEPAWLAEEIASADDSTPVILSAGQNQARPCELAAATLDLFVTILGAEAGNLALKILATGGIYLAGGMSPRILAELERPAFLEALRSKGRFRQVLTDMPVHVILNPGAGLLGAAAFGLAASAE